MITESGQEILTANDNKTPTKWKGEFPSGLVGEIAKWITNTARTQQPTLSVAAAIIIVAVAMGRQTIGPTGRGSVLYITTLANTGFGKDHPLLCVSQILQAAGLGEHVGSSEFMSKSGLVDELREKANMVSVIDEIGGFIRKITSAKSSHHETAIANKIRQMWGIGFNEMQSAAYAGKKSVPIIAPHLFIYGASTNIEFFDAISKGSLSDGTLNRFLFFSTSVCPKTNRNRLKDNSVPESIINQLKAIYNLSASDSPTEVPTRNDATFDPVSQNKVVKIDWLTEDLDNHFMDLEDELRAEMREAPEKAEHMVRRMDMAIRLATIIAVGCGRPSVSRDDLAFGVGIAKASERFMIEGVNDYVSENALQSLAQTILRKIKMKGGSCSRQQLTILMNKTCKSQELDEVCMMLQDTGEIVVELKTGESGRQSKYYTVVSNAAVDVAA